MADTTECQALVNQITQFGFNVRSSELTSCSAEELPVLTALYENYLNFATALSNVQKQVVFEANLSDFFTTVTAISTDLKSRQNVFKTFPTCGELTKLMDKQSGTAQLLDRVIQAQFQPHHWEAWQADVGEAVGKLDTQASLGTLWKAVEGARDAQVVPNLVEKAKTEGAARLKLSEVLAKTEACTLNFESCQNVVVLVSQLDESLATIQALCRSDVVQSLKDEAIALFTNIQEVRSVLTLFVDASTLRPILQTVFSDVAVCNALPEAKATFDQAQAEHDIVMSTTPQSVEQLLAETGKAWKTSVHALHQKLIDANTVVSSTLHNLRTASGRFHFLSDGELLQYISSCHAGNIEFMESSVRRFMNDVSKLIHHDGVIQGIEGEDGESVRFPNPIQLSHTEPVVATNALITESQKALMEQFHKLETLCSKFRSEKVIPLEFCNALLNVAPQIGAFSLLVSLSGLMHDAACVTSETTKIKAVQPNGVSILPTSSRPQTAPTRPKGGYKSPAARLETLTTSRCVSALVEPRPGSAAVALKRRPSTGKTDRKDKGKDTDKGDKGKKEAAPVPRGRPLSASQSSPKTSGTSPSHARPPSQKKEEKPFQSSVCGVGSKGPTHVAEYLREISAAITSLLQTPLSKKMRSRAERIAIMQLQLASSWFLDKSKEIRVKAHARPARITVLDVTIPNEFEFQGNFKPILFVDRVLASWEHSILAYKLRMPFLGVRKSGDSENVKSLAQLCGKFHPSLIDDQFTTEDFFGKLIGVCNTGAWGILDLNHVEPKYYSVISSLISEINMQRKFGTNTLIARGNEWEIKEATHFFAFLTATETTPIPNAVANTFYSAKVVEPDLFVLLQVPLIANGFEDPSSVARRLCSLINRVRSEHPSFDHLKYLGLIIQTINRSGEIYRRERGRQEVILGNVFSDYVLPKLERAISQSFHSNLRLYFNCGEQTIHFIPFVHALQAECTKQSLRCEGVWKESTIRLSEFIRLRKFVAVVGTHPTGKSTAIQSCVKCLNEVWETQNKILHVNMDTLSQEEFERHVASKVQQNVWLLLDGTARDMPESISQKYEKIIYETHTLNSVSPRLLPELGVVAFPDSFSPEYYFNAMEDTWANFAEQRKHWNQVTAFCESTSISFGHTHLKLFATFVTNLMKKQSLTDDQYANVFWYSLSWAFIGGAPAVTRDYWTHAIVRPALKSSTVDPFRMVLDEKFAWSSPNVPLPLTSVDPERMRSKVFDELVSHSGMSVLDFITSKCDKVSVFVIGDPATGKTRYVRQKFSKDSFYNLHVSSTMKSSSFGTLIASVAPSENKTFCVCVNDMHLASETVQANLLTAMTMNQIYIPRADVDILSVKCEKWYATGTSTSSLSSRLVNHFFTVWMGAPSDTAEIDVSATDMFRKMFPKLGGAEKLSHVVADLLPRASWTNIIKVFRLLAIFQLDAGLIPGAVRNILQLLNLEPSVPVLTGCAGFENALEDSDLWVVGPKDSTASNINLKSYFETVVPTGVMCHPDFLRLMSNVSTCLAAPAVNLLMTGPPGAGKRTAVRMVCKERGITPYEARNGDDLYSYMRTAVMKCAKGESVVIILSQSCFVDPKVPDLMMICVKSGVPDDMFTAAERSALKADSEKFGRHDRDPYRVFQSVVRDHLHFVVVVESVDDIEEQWRTSITQHFFPMVVAPVSSASVAQGVEQVCKTNGAEFGKMYDVVSKVMIENASYIPFPDLKAATTIYSEYYSAPHKQKMDKVGQCQRSLAVLRELRYELNLLSTGSVVEKHYTPDPTMTLMEGWACHKLYAKEPLRLMMAIVMSEEGSVVDIPACAFLLSYSGTEVLAIPAQSQGLCKATVTPPENGTVKVVISCGNVELRGVLSSQLNLVGEFYDNGSLLGQFELAETRAGSPNLAWLRHGENPPSQGFAEATGCKGGNNEVLTLVQNEIQRIDRVYSDIMKGLPSMQTEALLLSAFPLYSGMSTAITKAVDTALEEWCKVSPHSVPRQRVLAKVSQGEWIQSYLSSVGKGMPGGLVFEAALCWLTRNERPVLLHDPEGLALCWLKNLHPDHEVIPVEHLSDTLHHNAIITGVSSSSFQKLQMMLNLEDPAVRSMLIMIGGGPYSEDMKSTFKIINCSFEALLCSDHFLDSVLWSDKVDLFNQTVDVGTNAETAQNVYLESVSFADVWNTSAIEAYQSVAQADLKDKSIRAGDLYRSAASAAANEARALENVSKEKKSWEDVSLLAASFAMTAASIQARTGLRTPAPKVLEMIGKIPTITPKATAETARVAEVRDRIIQLLCNRVLCSLADQQRLDFAFSSAVRYQMLTKEVTDHLCVEYLRGTNLYDMARHVLWEQEQDETIETNYEKDLARYQRDLAAKALEDEKIAASPVVKSKGKTEEDPKAKQKKLVPPVREPIPYRHKPLYSFLSDQSWQGVLHLADTVKVFEKLCEMIHDREKNPKIPKEQKWKEWLEDPSTKPPEVEKDAKLTAFNRFLLVSALRPDRTLITAVQYINEVFGNSVDPFVATEDSVAIDLLDSSNATSPFMVMMQPGEDFSGLQFIEAASVSMNVELTEANIVTVNGRNDGDIVRLIRSCRSRGVWAIVLEFEMASNELMNEIYGILLEGEGQSSFKLIFTWNVSVAPVCHPLLANSVRLSRCVPKTIKTMMTKVYSTFSEESFKFIAPTNQHSQILYNLNLLTSVLETRKRFGIQGYRTKNCNFKVGHLVTVLQLLSSSTKNISWSTLRQLALRLLTAEIEDVDEAAIASMVDWWLHPDLCKSGSQWAKGYRSPDDDTVKGHQMAIEMMPAVDAPEVMGIPSTVERICGEDWMSSTVKFSQEYMFTNLQSQVKSRKLSEVADLVLTIIDPINQYDWIGLLTALNEQQDDPVYRQLKAEITTLRKRSAHVIRTMKAIHSEPQSIQQSLLYGKVPPVWGADGSEVLIPWLHRLVASAETLSNWILDKAYPPVINMQHFDNPKGMLDALLADAAARANCQKEFCTFRFVVGSVNLGGLVRDRPQVLFFSGLMSETMTVNSNAPYNAADAPDVYSEYWKPRTYAVPIVTAILSVQDRSGDVIAPTKYTDGDLIFTRSKATTFVGTRPARRMSGSTEEGVKEINYVIVPVYRNRNTLETVCDVEVPCLEELNHWAARGPRFFL